MTGKEKFLIVFLVLLIIVQVCVLSYLIYDKYLDKPTKIDDSINVSKIDDYDTLLNTILSSDTIKTTIENSSDSENNSKDIDNSTIKNVIQKLRENTSIENSNDEVDSNNIIYSYIVTYKVNDEDKTFKFLLTNEETKAIVFINDEKKVYNFKDSLSSFMSDMYNS